MDRAFSTVLHRCFFTHKKLQSVLNYADLPLSISYYRLLCKMLFRINVSIKKRKTHRWGEILCFIFVFVIMQTCMLQKMYNSAHWGHPFRWVAEFGVTLEPDWISIEYPLKNNSTRYGTQATLTLISRINPKSDFSFIDSEFKLKRCRFFFGQIHATAAWMQSASNGSWGDRAITDSVARLGQIVREIWPNPETLSDCWSQCTSAARRTYGGRFVSLLCNQK